MPTKNLFSETESRGRIFRNENALLPDYAPADLLHREPQLQEAARALKPLAAGSKPANLFIYGPTGTGKTSSVKHVFGQLGEYSGKVACIYVNCWEYSSKQAVLSKMAEAFQEPLPRRGLATDEVFQRVMQRAKYDGKGLVIALDEADRLFSRDAESLLYELARAHELFKVPVAVVAISNNYELISSLDDRARSSLSLRPLEFPRYTPQQLKDIVRERARAAFQQGSCPEEVVALCAAHGSKGGGDARVAITALLEAARNAEAAGRAAIELADARKAVDQAAGVSLKKNLSLMSENERLLFKILDGAKAAGIELSSGDLYSRYNGARKESGLEGLSERQLRNYLDSFERARLVVTRDADFGDKGRTRLIRLR
ncbi:MAG: AAA family ATPase [Candidatus Micrarchaeota archaeon]